DLDTTAEALTRAVGDAVADLQQRLATLHATLREFRPDQTLAMRRHELGAQAARLEQLLGRALQAHKHELERLGTMLRILGPQATLSRGYSIARIEGGAILRSTQQA